MRDQEGQNVCILSAQRGACKANREGLTVARPSYPKGGDSRRPTSQGEGQQGAAKGVTIARDQSVSPLESAKVIHVSGRVTV